MAVLRYYKLNPRTTVQESSVKDTQNTALTSKLSSINASILNIQDLIDDKQDKIDGRTLTLNNFTDYYKQKLSDIEEGAEVNVQSDWNTTDEEDDSYIKNKPESLPASDVYEWAKQPEKPTYTKDEVGLSNVTNDAQVKRSEMGAANGVATLNESGIIYSSQLPSYVDDVLEYAGMALFPAVGESGKIYVDTITDLTYRWSGSTYVEISKSLALGETATTAYAGNKGKALADTISNTSNKAATLQWGTKTVLATVNGIDITATLPSNPDTDTGVTSVTVNGSGNAITTASVSGRILTLTKGATFLTGHQSLTGRYPKYNTTNVNPESGFEDGYGVGMTTSSGIDGNWWHIFSAGWSGNSNWVSLLALPTLNRNGVYYRSRQGGTSYAWTKLLDAANYSSYALPLSGGTMTGPISKAGTDVSWRQGRDTTMIRTTSYSGYNALVSMKTTNGSWDLGVYSGDTAYLTYITDANYNANNNVATHQLVFPKANGTIALTSQIPAVSGVYLPLSGGTLTGNLAIKHGTAASNTYADGNPKLIFQNSDASLNISLTYTDYDSVLAPASLTLNGNQGEEYLIAPNIKSNGIIRVGNSQTRYSSLKVQFAGSSVWDWPADNANTGNGLRTRIWTNSNNVAHVGMFMTDPSSTTLYYMMHMNASNHRLSIKTGSDPTHSIDCGTNDVGMGALYLRNYLHFHEQNNGNGIGLSHNTIVWMKDAVWSYDIFKFHENNRTSVGDGGAASYTLHIKGSCGATSFNNTSDMRLKDVLEDYNPSIEDIANAPSFKFTWKEGEDKDLHIGTSAQYWQEKCPEVVTEATADEMHTLSVQYGVLGTINTISLAKEVLQLKEEIKLMQALIAELKLLLNN